MLIKGNYSASQRLLDRPQPTVNVSFSWVFPAGSLFFFPPALAYRLMNAFCLSESGNRHGTEIPRLVPILVRVEDQTESEMSSERFRGCPR